MKVRTKVKACLVVSIFLLGINCATAVGRTIYVDNDGPADFNTIQAAIDDSNDGDTIIVADGIYKGEGNRDINFNGKAITVRSTNGPQNCIIDCNGSESDRHRGFRFVSGEDANSVIMAFTITNGYAQYEVYMPPLGVSEYLGGAIYCWRSSPTISDCIISCNRAGTGFGGGISCVFSNATMSNCTFTSNWARVGGGIDIIYGSPTVTNCTLAGNVAESVGGIRDDENTKVTNCILWGNRDKGGIDESAQIYGSEMVVNYCCIQGLTGALGGIGNIGDDPYFADPCNDDYHLKSQAGRWEPNSQNWVHDGVTSPCIDAGDIDSPVGLETFPNGGRINMGAFGGTAEASKSYFGEPVCTTIVAGDINGDCKVGFLDFSIMALHWLRDENK